MTGFSVTYRINSRINFSTLMNVVKDFRFEHREAPILPQVEDDESPSVDDNRGPEMTCSSRGSFKTCLYYYTKTYLAKYITSQLLSSSFASEFAKRLLDSRKNPGLQKRRRRCSRLLALLQSWKLVSESGVLQLPK